jgi:hypothetical protein
MILILVVPVVLFFLRYIFERNDLNISSSSSSVFFLYDTILKGSHGNVWHRREMMYKKIFGVMIWKFLCRFSVAIYNHELVIPVLLIHDILVWTADLCLRLMDADPSNFIIDLQDANKKQIFK